MASVTVPPLPKLTPTGVSVALVMARMFEENEGPVFIESIIERSGREPKIIGQPLGANSSVRKALKLLRDAGCIKMYPYRPAAKINGRPFNAYKPTPLWPGCIKRVMSREKTEQSLPKLTLAEVEVVIAVYQLLADDTEVTHESVVSRSGHGEPLVKSTLRLLRDEGLLESKLLKPHDEARHRKARSHYSPTTRWMILSSTIEFLTSR